MTNDPAAVEWLERQFDKQFRPGGGQRIDMDHYGSRGEEELFDPVVTIRPEAPPVAAVSDQLASEIGYWRRVTARIMRRMEAL